jgi:hypothetical protein
MNENGNDWELDTNNLNVNVAILLRGRTLNFKEWMKKMKESAEELDIRIIYKKVSTGPIRIMDGYYTGEDVPPSADVPDDERK